MINPAFSFQHVTKEYGRGHLSTRIFDDLCLDIEANDFVALMGPSGSGKTTLLNLMGGIDRITTGSLLYQGARIDGYSEAELTRWRKAQIGFVFQTYNLIPVLTAGQNIELPLLLTGLGRRERAAKVQLALELMGLGAYRDQMPLKMSGGQQQRISIARAMVSDAPVLLCDEPTGNLDRDTAEEVMGILQLLNREHGKTIILVTHDAAAARHARRTICLDKGRLFTQKESSLA